MKFSDKVKARYEQVKLKNSIMFSNMMLRDLNLGVSNDGFIYAPEVLNPYTNSPESFSFNGYRYVEYTDRGVALDEENPDVRLFDPYNNLQLMIYCLQWYLVNEKEIDINNDILSMLITNNKMNTIGHMEIKLFRDADLSKYENIPEFNKSFLTIVGHDYHRDCLKYYDMMMILDNSLPFEFYKDEIAQIDMEPFDEVYDREMNAHDIELDKRKHITRKQLIQFKRDLL